MKQMCCNMTSGDDFLLVPSTFEMALIIDGEERTMTRICSETKTWVQIDWRLDNGSIQTMEAYRWCVAYTEMKTNHDDVNQNNS